MLRIYYQNLRGINTKLGALRSAIMLSSYDVMVFTETWLSPSIMSSEFVDERYLVYRSDRDPLATGKLRGGGVAICLDARCQSRLIFSQNDEFLEDLCIWFKINETDVILSVVYIPPCSSSAAYDAHARRLRDVFATYPEAVFFSFGDFNLPNIEWHFDEEMGSYIPTNLQDPNHGTFLCDVMSSGMLQLNGVVNNNGVLLDLVFSSVSCNVVGAVDVLLPCDSHHPALEVCLPVPSSSEEVHGLGHNFRDADYSAISMELDAVNWCTLNDVALDEAVEVLYSVLNSTIDKYVPVRANCRSSFPHLFLSDLKRLVTRKKVAHNY